MVDFFCIGNLALIKYTQIKAVSRKQGNLSLINRSNGLVCRKFAQMEVLAGFFDFVSKVSCR